MAQTAYSGHLEVHPSEAIEISGTTDNGRYLSIYLSKKDTEILRATFEFSAKHCPHLGHSFWHVTNGITEPCPHCEVAHS
jgi:hypothetical protein